MRALAELETTSLWMTILIVYLILVNFLAFILYGVDKRRAIRQTWRIKERTLLLVAAVGGALGALLGMLAFHHKVRKPRFWVIVLLSLAVWTVGCYFLFRTAYI